MKSLTLPETYLLMMLITFIASCAKPIDTNENECKKVSYKIEGDYTGTVSVKIKDNISEGIALNELSVPWQKDTCYKLRVTSTSLEVSGLAAGNPGQKITVGIFIDGKPAKTVTGTTDRNGVLTLPLITQEIP